MKLKDIQGWVESWRRNPGGTVRLLLLGCVAVVAIAFLTAVGWQLAERAMRLSPVELDEELQDAVVSADTDYIRDRIKQNPEADWTPFLFMVLKA